MPASRRRCSTTCSSPSRSFETTSKHFERDLDRGLQAGEPMMLIVLAEAVYLNKRELPYSMLASAIDGLYTSAGLFLDVIASVAEQ
jgi:hypothetical protein